MTPYEQDKAKLFNAVKVQNNMRLPVAARKFRWTQNYTLQVAEDAGINVNVAMGSGSGIADLPRSEWTLEVL